MLSGGSLCLADYLGSIMLLAIFNWGWTIGGGAEYAFDENWIIGAEYLFVDLGDNDFDFDSNLKGDNSDGNVDVQFSVVRARLSYKF